MPKYIKWIETIFERLYSELDSERQINRAREKYHLYEDHINKFFARRKEKREDVIINNDDAKNPKERAEEDR